MSNSARLNREEFRDAKRLEEARKAGIVSNAVDSITGKEINPHIPSFIANAPWYLQYDQPTLTHQKAPDKGFDSLEKWYSKGATAGQATKYRKGACENCGAMSHKTKECTERPRKIGAKWNGQDIKPDELITDVKLDFEGKRDRWNGYDPNEHVKVMEKFAKLEEERRKAKQLEEEAKLKEIEQAHEKVKEQQEKEKSSENSTDTNNATETNTTEKKKKKKKTKKQTEEDDSSSSSDSDDLGGRREDDDFKTEGQTLPEDPKKRTLTRTLRIREDTAKYLRNLDLNSAYYDPKSRSMRDNPNPDKPEEEQVYRGDNIFRHAGEVKDFQQLQKFAWVGSDKIGMKNTPFNPAASPSQAELTFKQLQQKTQEATSKRSENLSALYGSQDKFKADPKDIPKESNEYVVYNPEGSEVKKQGSATVAIPSSKYPEDILIGNHTKVWGSWWEAGKWGYGCCRQYERKSYCTGSVGIHAKDEIEKQTYEERQKIFDRAKKMRDEAAQSSTLSSSKRPYSANEIDDKEYEEYQKSKRQRTDDPMYKSMKNQSE